MALRTELAREGARAMNMAFLTEIAGGGAWAIDMALRTELARERLSYEHGVLNGARLFGDPALTGADELHQVLEFGAGRQVGLESCPDDRRQSLYTERSPRRRILRPLLSAQNMGGDARPAMPRQSLHSAVDEKRLPSLIALQRIG